MNINEATLAAHLAQWNILKTLRGYPWSLFMQNSSHACWHTFPPHLLQVLITTYSKDRECSGSLFNKQVKFLDPLKIKNDRFPRETEAWHRRRKVSMTVGIVESRGQSPYSVSGSPVWYFVGSFSCFVASSFSVFLISHLSYTPPLWTVSWAPSLASVSWSVAPAPPSGSDSVFS